MVHDVALRLLGDEAGAARVTCEVLLRAVGRAADGDAKALTDAGLLRAVVRHADALRTSGAVVPTLSGPGVLTRTVQRDGRGRDRAAVAACALGLDLDALVTLDLQLRHRFDDRIVAAVLDRPRTEVAEILDAAATRVARQTNLSAPDTRSLYASLATVPAPDAVHATVAAAAHRNPAVAPAGARPLVAWVVAALVIAATLIGVADLVTGWDRGPAEGELQVAVAIALVDGTSGTGVELAQTSTTGRDNGTSTGPVFSTPAAEQDPATAAEQAEAATDRDEADTDEAPTSTTGDEPADEQDQAPSDSEEPDDDGSVPAPNEPTVGPLDPLLPGA